MASERPLHPNTSHARSPVCFSHVLMPHSASLKNPEAGLGLHQLGERAQQCLAWTLKVGRSTWFLIDNLCSIRKQLLQKDKRCFGLKSEPNGRTTVNIVLYGGVVPYGWTPYFQTDRTCTILYGELRYGTVNTVKEAKVWRISTGLILLCSTFYMWERPRCSPGLTALLFRFLCRSLSLAMVRMQCAFTSWKKSFLGRCLWYSSKPSYYFICRCLHKLNRLPGIFC